MTTSFLKRHFIHTKRSMRHSNGTYRDTSIGSRVKNSLTSIETAESLEIRSNKNPDYKPKKETAISLALGMKLSEEDAESFLQSAGYKFYDSDKTDAVARELLREGNYNRFDWNEKIYKKTGRVFFNM